MCSRSSFQHTTQNPKIHGPSHARDWWFLHHWPEMIISMDNMPSWFETLQKSHLFIPTINFSDVSNICFKMRSFPVFWWNVNYLNISFPWIQMLPMLKTWTVHKWKNVYRCLALHLLKNGPISFAIDLSPCSRMTVILEKGSILQRCHNSYHDKLVCLLGEFLSTYGLPPFLLPTFHQISTLERPLVVNVPF